MAQFRSHRQEQAQAALALGALIVETKLPKLERGHLGPGWTECVMAHALLKEAKTLIESADKPGQ